VSGLDLPTLAALAGLSCAGLAGCAAPAAPSRAPSSAPAGASAPAAAPDPAAPAPAPDATRFLLEAEIYEMPLALAEDLYGRADEREATIGTFPDEAQCRAALERLAPAHPAIAHLPSASRTLEIGRLETLLPRDPGSASSERAPASPVKIGPAHASDFLGLKVRLTRSEDWAPFDLETQIVWTDATGRILARLPSAKSALHDGYWMEIACLPARRDAAQASIPAVFVFVRVISPDPASRADASPR
jgi:hypothetical protein